MSSINDLAIRDDVIEETPSELPIQMGGQGLPTLLPGTHIFRLPSDVPSLIEAYDEILKDEQGNPVPDPADPNKARVIQRLRVRFDKDNPLLVVGSEDDGAPVTTSISNQPRNRARKGEPRVLVSDLAYLLRESLQYKGPLSKNTEWVHALMQFGGKIFRVEHGLSAFCNPEKVRYIHDTNDPTLVASIQDPSGQHGCGHRLYTSAFKLPAQNGQRGGYSDIAYCPKCSAKLRGFFQIEKFLKPTPAMLADDPIPF
jgi:hypothetical protein